MRIYENFRVKKKKKKKEIDFVGDIRAALAGLGVMLTAGHPQGSFPVRLVARRQPCVIVVAAR